jgi:LysM repeat protein
MRNLRQALWAVLLALISIGFTLGGASLSLAEGNLTAPTPSETLLPAPTATEPPLTPLPPDASSPTPQPPTPTWTPSLPPPPTNCPPPAGWVPYVIQTGDTLEKVAANFNVPASQLGQANCLLTSSLLPGAVIYVPPVPTQTSPPCGAPDGWVTYVVRKGDTLFHLAQAYGVTIAELQQANCMGNSSLLHTGQQIYVPPGPTRTPTVSTTSKPTVSLTPSNTFTRTTGVPTATTPSSTPTASNTPPFPASSTPSFTPSDTPSGTPTVTPSSTPTSTPSPSATDTP